MGIREHGAIFRKDRNDPPVLSDGKVLLLLIRAFPGKGFRKSLLNGSRRLSGGFRVAKASFHAAKAGMYPGILKSITVLHVTQILN